MQKNKRRGSGPRPNSGRQSSGNRNNKKKSKDFDLHSFLKDTIAVETKDQELLTESIKSLPIKDDIKANLHKMGYKQLTEIQSGSLKPLMDGRDLMGIAQTGTGKTAAFLIPIINRLIGTNAMFQVLIVLPTRELALQVDQEFRKITKGINLFSQCFVGGINIQNDLKALSRPSHVIIGTPGRLLDLKNQGKLKYDKFDTLVLDEFDRLLDMGFLSEIQKMIRSMPNRRQTILFSATEEPKQMKIINEMLNKPATVRVHGQQKIGDQIKQELVKVNEGDDKFEMLRSMLVQEDFTKVLIFAETKRGVSRLCKKLNKTGMPSEQIHGDRSQNQRIRALNLFDQGKVRILLATDVAARGLHIEDVSHVINYQTPKNADSYIHRVGRTGRAGKSGVAYTFV